MNLEIKQVERIPFSVPFREVPARNMVRELPHWTLFEICRVTLQSGIVGFGETMQYYTWGTVSDAAVEKCIGCNAAELMWDDSLGAGLQMALFDAVGKANDVPVHRLLGAQHRDRCFLSWWDIDMPAEDWVLECRQAISEGYTAFKTKARPWFDLDHQCKVLCETLPPWFDLDLDFNSMLVDAPRASRLLPEIEKYSHVKLYETPLPQDDVRGNNIVRTKTNVAIAMHFGVPPIMTALKEEVCDGFVIGGGASKVVRDATLAAAANKPFFLQLVGTGITCAFAIHLGAVLSHARWPAVNCHQLYTHPMVKPAITVSNGLADVPEAPGLGVELDEETVERFRLPEMPPKPYPAPKLLLAIRWPSGASSYYTHTMQYWEDFTAGRLPLFPSGVYLESIPDDGSSEWRDLQERAQRAPVHTGSRAG
ncbi:MAG: dgoA protein, partial [Armatimonadetes bacterium CG_4_9_14_3_um_filter_58_7]